MKLLDPLAYRRLADGAKPDKASPEAIAQILAYAHRVFRDRGLVVFPTMKPPDVARVTSNASAMFFHVRPFSFSQPETFMIVAADDDGEVVKGDILLEHATRAPKLYTEEHGDIVDVTPERAAGIVFAIDVESDDPFAILSMSDGSYVQTAADDECDDFHLELQLVTTECHYRATSLVPRETVAAVFESYAKSRGDLAGDWLEMVKWHHMRLELPTS